MCIRDRRRIVQGHVIEEVLDFVLCIRSDLGVHPEAQAREAVSYTHLRAHETVLDLVCRLLLEKKKTHNQHMSTLLQKTTARNSKAKL